MKIISNLLLALGLLLVAYAVFSNFYGADGVALNGLIRSRTLLTGGSTCLLLSLIATVRDLCKK